MQISHIHLRNIRGFRSLRLEFDTQRAGVRAANVIIGRNGTCKTTLLRSIALGLCEPDQANALIAEPFGPLIAEDSDTASIRISLKASRPSDKVRQLNITTTIARRNRRELVIRQSRLPRNPPQPLFVCAYGAGRSSEGPDTGRRYQIVDSVYSLFNYDQTLISPELALRRLRDFVGTKTYDRALTGIKHALGLKRGDQIRVQRGGGLYVSGKTIGKKVSLEGWADGYRKTLAWIVDIYAWAMRAEAITPDGSISGILLIDEPEQHLHPSLQTSILSDIHELFPHVQVFAATHSPMIALNSNPDDIIVLKRVGHHIRRQTEIPDFFSYSTHDMLEDDRLFSTSAMGRRYSQLVEEYEKLSVIPDSRRKTTHRTQLRNVAKTIRDSTPDSRKSELAKEIDRLRKRFDL